MKNFDRIESLINDFIIPEVLVIFHLKLVLTLVDLLQTSAKIGSPYIPQLCYGKCCNINT